MIFLEFYYKIQGSHLRNFSKKGKKSSCSWFWTSETPFWHMWMSFGPMFEFGKSGGRHLFGLNVTLMTGDDGYFSKASPFKIMTLTENLDNLGQKVTLLTNWVHLGLPMRASAFCFIFLCSTRPSWVPLGFCQKKAKKSNFEF